MGVAGEVALPVPVAGVTTGEGTEVGVRSGLALGTGSEVVTGAGILGPAPESFNATTKNVYLISGERPVNVAVPPAPPPIVTHLPPGIAITVIDLIGELPVSAGGWTVTDCVAPRVETSPITGTPGAPWPITGFCNGSKDTHLR